MAWFIELEEQTESRQGSDVRFDCPACGRRDVVGSTSEVTHQGRLFWVIPLFRSRETSIRCTQCGESLGVLCSLTALAYKPREELGRVIRYRAGTGAKLMAALSLLFCWNPILCLPLVLGTKWAARGTKGWPQDLSTVSLVLTLALVVVVAMLVAAEVFGVKF